MRKTKYYNKHIPYTEKYNNLTNMIFDEILLHDRMYHNWSKHIFYRECAESIADKIITDPAMWIESYEITTKQNKKSK